jgi:hypothetical protein
MLVRETAITVPGSYGPLFLDAASVTIVEDVGSNRCRVHTAHNGYFEIHQRADIIKNQVIGKMVEAEKLYAGKPPETPPVAPTRERTTRSETDHGDAPDAGKRQWGVKLYLSNGTIRHVTVCTDMAWPEAIDQAVETMLNEWGPRPDGVYVLAVICGRVSWNPALGNWGPLEPEHLKYVQDVRDEDGWTEGDKRFLSPQDRAASKDADRQASREAREATGS